jgi:hypothetical protein
MTEFAPSGALRAQVLEQVQQWPRQSSHAVPSWTWARAAAAASVVLAVAAAVWVVGPLRTRDDGLSTVSELRSGVPSPAAAGTDRPVTKSAASPEAVSPAGEFPPITLTSRPAGTRGRRTAEGDNLQDRHPVPALADIEPLSFASVEPAPLQIAGVEISPIAEMPSIDIPGLDPSLHDIQAADSKKEK